MSATTVVYGMVELGVNPAFAKTVFGGDGTISDGMDVVL
jgi:hypothetical protein